MKRIASLVLISLALSGCGQNDQNAPAVEPGDDTPVVARYAGGTVTRREADRALAGWPGRDEAGSVAERRVQAVRDLVWRRMLVENHREAIESTPHWQFHSENLKRQLAVGLIASQLAAEATVDLTRVDEIVEQRLAKFESSTSLRVRHVFVRADRTMSESQKSEATARIGEVEQRIRGGEDFAELAGRFSDSETAANGGLINGLTRGFSHPYFERAAFSLDPGEVSGIVETPNGYHIVKLEERFEPPPPDRETIAAAVREEQLRFAAVALRDELVAALGRFEKVEEFWDADGLQPDAETGALLKVAGNTIVTFVEFESVIPDPHVNPSFAIEQLAAIRDAELLLIGVRRRGLAGDLKTTFSAAHEKAVERRAVAWELKSIVDDVPLSELEKFARRHPRYLEIPATNEARIIFLPFPEKTDPYEVFLRAERLVEQARAGADFAMLARAHSAVAPEQGGYLGELDLAGLTAYGMELTRTVTDLQPSEISDPVRITGRKFGGGEKVLKNGILIARVERRSSASSLDLSTDEDRIRAVFAEVSGKRLLAASKDAMLTSAGFEMVAGIP